MSTIIKLATLRCQSNKLQVIKLRFHKQWYWTVHIGKLKALKHNLNYIRFGVEGLKRHPQKC